MNQPPYEFTALARLDVLRIWNYVAEADSIGAADRVTAEIRKIIEKVVKSPRLGHARPDLTDRNLLFVRAFSYFIIYRPDKRPLRIVRVMHAAQDVKTLLEN